MTFSNVKKLQAEEEKKNTGSTKQAGPEIQFSKFQGDGLKCQQIRV